MFIKNKYTKWYYAIINRSCTRANNEYTEKHHIIPKSLGGNNHPTNLVRLTMREHFVCHQLLIRMLDGESRYKMLHAAWRLAHQKGQKITSRQYEILKKLRSNAMTGRKNPAVSVALTGRKVPREVIAKRVATVTGSKRPATSAALRGRSNPKASLALTGRKQTAESVKKRADSLRGKPSGAKGRKQSDEEKAMRSRLMSGRPSPHKGKPWSESRRRAYEKSKENK
jgi:hypothetical protein